MKFKADEPFFIMGEAGWGKTSIIKSMAKRFGRRVITIYLDKCEATDLGGIPVPREDKRGNAYVDSAMPAWAQYMLEHEDDQFLLFFQGHTPTLLCFLKLGHVSARDNEVCTLFGICGCDAVAY